MNPFAFVFLNILLMAEKRKQAENQLDCKYYLISLLILVLVCTAALQLLSSPSKYVDCSKSLAPNLEEDWQARFNNNVLELSMLIKKSLIAV